MSVESLHIDDVARAVLADIPKDRRFALLVEQLTAAEGEEAIGYLIGARNALTDRIHDLLIEWGQSEARIGSLQQGSGADIVSLPRPCCAAGNRADLGAAVAATPRPEARNLGWSIRDLVARGRGISRWLDDHWIGNLIGVLCLFGSLYGLTLILWVLS